MTPLDAAVAAYVSTRHGVLALAEAKRLGLSIDQVRWRVDAGLWQRLHRGVYCVGPSEPPFRARCRAAVLAIGKGASVSHLSAAALYHLIPPHDGPIHVVATRKLDAREDIEVHWTRHPPAPHERHGIPVTTLGRTLADAADLTAETEPLIRSAERLFKFDRRAIPRIEGRTGRGRVHGGTFARGHLIRRFKRLCDEAGFRRPETEYQLLGYEIDAAWPDQRIAVEIDDYLTHDNRDAMDADRERDLVLHVAGWKPVRVTHAHLTRGREALVARLVALGAPPG